jgi:hypothetical protein
MTQHVPSDVGVRLMRNLIGERVTKVLRMNVLFHLRPLRHTDHQLPKRLRRRRTARVVEPLRVERRIPKALSATTRAAAAARSARPGLESGLVIAQRIPQSQWTD